MKEYRGNGRVMHAILDDKARKLGSKVFARWGRDALTYEELREQSSSVASFLVHSLGVSKNDKIARIRPNRLAYLTIQFGISKAGGVMVPVTYSRSRTCLRIS